MKIFLDKFIEKLDLKKIPPTLFIKAWSFINVPMIFFLKPRVLELNDEYVEVLIPLRYQSKNHLGSLYFGALMCGADLAGGLIAVSSIYQSGEKVNFVFSSTKAEFLKRPLSDVLFTCNDGLKSKKLVRDAIEIKERVSEEMNIIATCPKSDNPNEIYARFTLTISLKYAKK